MPSPVRPDPTSPEPEASEGLFRPKHAGIKAAILLVCAPLLVAAVIIGGRLLLPVKELKLAPRTPFEIARSDTAPRERVEAPMVALPAGSFTMGSTERNEAPPHPVAVAAFAIDPELVTVRDYRACVAARRCSADGLDGPGPCNWGAPGREAHPMNCVDWNEADIYCRWIGRRLPTEEEWEYAARGPTGRLFPWGSEAPDETRACFGRDATCEAGAHPAGRTPEGVADLAGNVWEWTSSPYCGYATPGCASVERVVRGNSFRAREPARLRASQRSGHVITSRETFLGFRCARGG
jgi:formylglycine-generating enzyme required for sulfatase activity